MSRTEHRTVEIPVQPDTLARVYPEVLATREPDRRVNAGVAAVDELQATELRRGLAITVIDLPAVSHV
jgi:hypothetical protein